MRLYVDDRGHLLTSAKLRRALHSDLGQEELCAYAITNLGYIVIEQRRQTIRLCLRPRAVSQVTLAALLFWLGDRPIDRAIISHYDHVWHHEVVGPLDAIFGRLGKLVVDPLILRQGDFHRKRQTKLVAALAPLIREWHRNPATPFSVRCRGLLKNELGGRYMVLKRAQWSRRLEIRDVGHGFLVYDDAWLANAIGRPFEDQPDHLYGRWAAEAYYEASATEQALIDDVDAFIDRPGRGKVRLRYQRIVLPCRQPCGDYLLLCASLLDRSINLRGDAA